MHLPDGVLDPKIWATMDIVTVATVGYALRRTDRQMDEKKIPMMGVTAAFVFAAQLMNVPTPGGPPVHLIGAVLAAVLLGPWPAVLVMTAVMSVQALLLQDGGLLALGANIFNVGIIGALGGYAIYRGVRLLIKGDRGVVVATFAAAWISILVATLVVSAEMIYSGAVPAKLVLPALGSINFVVGAIEGLVSATIVGFVLKVRRDLIHDE
jgi:cobalt/nickel transport system permease protein